MVRGNNTPYTFSTPILIRNITNVAFPDAPEEYTITYPDDSSITVSTGELNLDYVYLPAGTKFEFHSKTSSNILQYIECKYV